METDGNKKRNFNSFHRFTVQKLQNKFHQEIMPAKGRRLISACSIISQLVHKRKFSKQIYFYVNEALILRIMAEIQKGEAKSIESV